MAIISSSLPPVASSRPSVTPSSSWFQWTVSPLKNPYILAVGAIALLAILWIFQQKHPPVLPASAILQLNPDVFKAIKLDISDLDTIFYTILTIKENETEILRKQVMSTDTKPILFLPHAHTQKSLNLNFKVEVKEGLKPFSKTIDFALDHPLGLYSLSLKGKLSSVPLEKVELPEAELSIDPLLNQTLPFDRNLELKFAPTGICHIGYNNGYAPGWIYHENHSPFYQVVTLTVQDLDKKAPPMEVTLTLDPHTNQGAYHSSLLQREWAKFRQDNSPISLLSVQHQAYKKI